MQARKEQGPPFERILRVASSEEDDYLKVELAEAVLEFGDVRGIPILLRVMDTGEAEQARRDAFEHLRAHVKLGLPFAADAAASEHETEIDAYRSWWEQHGTEVDLIEPQGER